MNRSTCKLLLLFLCASTVKAWPDGLQPNSSQPVIQIAQKLLSNIGRFPSAIHQGMSGNTDEIRKIVSSALGGGIISQIVENPLAAAGNFGIDLNQFGLNKTQIANTMGKINHTPGGYGDLLFSNAVAQTTSVPQSTTSGPLFIDGRRIDPKNEHAVLHAILGPEGSARRPPGTVRDNRQQPSPRMQPRRLDFNQQMNGANGHFRRTAKRPQMIQREYVEQIMTTTPVPESPPTTPGIDFSIFKNGEADPFLRPLVNMMITPRLPSNDISDDVTAPTTPVPEFREEKEIRRSPQRFPEINKLQQKIHNIEQILQQQHEELEKKQAQEKEIPDIHKMLERIHRTRGLSALGNHLRYAPDISADNLRLDVPLPDTVPTDCKCENVPLTALKGKWVQALASPSITEKINQGVSILFDSENARLNCSQLHVTPPREMDPLYSHVVWTMKLTNSSNVVRVSGNVFSAQHNQLILRLEGFNDDLFDIPLCVHKVDKNSQYIVISEAANCQAATLLVKNPEELFRNTNVELTKFLRKSIAAAEMDRMELVEHADACLS